jgi:hypothetical protein
MSPFAVIATLICSISLAGCGGTGEWARSVGAKIDPDSQSLADRCGQIMKAAMPFADIELGNHSSDASGITKITARIEGARKDLSPDTGGRNLAAECTFDNATLTGFRWTKGGPSSPPETP